MRFKTVLAVAGFAVVGFAAGQLLSQEAKEASASKADDTKMMEVMAAYAKYAQPGKHHKALTTFIGKWDTKNKFRMGPDAPWQENAAVSEVKWLFDGKILQQTMKNEFMGQVWEGHGIWGYDNIKQEYWNLWMDSMTTGAMWSKGQANSTLDEITFKSTIPDATKNMQDSPVKFAMKIVDNDTWNFDMWTADENGKMYHHFHSTYTRIK